MANSTTSETLRQSVTPLLKGQLAADELALETLAFPLALLQLNGITNLFIITIIWETTLSIPY